VVVFQDPVLSASAVASTNDGFNEYSELSAHNIGEACSMIPSVPGNDDSGRYLSGLSAARHIHHAPDFGLDPTDYGMTQADLDNIAKIGLINHIRNDGTAAEFVQAFQERWKRFAEGKDVRACGVQRVMGKPCHVWKHDPSRTFLAFRVGSGESLTGSQLTPDQSEAHDQTGRIGKNYQ
jgi:hypothetical protein